MFKMPDPVGAIYTIAGIQHYTLRGVLPDTDLYIEAQLKQVRREALEESLTIVSKHGYGQAPKHIYAEIRKLQEGL